MERLLIEETKYTPKVDLDPATGVFSIVGKSYPENTFEFYAPVMDWVENYFQVTSQNETTVNFEILYFNSSTSKLFFEFFDLLEESILTHKIIINWLYDEEDETTREAGEDFQEDCENLQINLIIK